LQDVKKSYLVDLSGLLSSHSPFLKILKIFLSNKRLVQTKNASANSMFKFTTSSMK